MYCYNNNIIINIIYLIYLLFIMNIQNYNKHAVWWWDCPAYVSICLCVWVFCMWKSWGDRLSSLWKKSRNGMLLSVSIVNSSFEWMLFICVMNSVNVSFLCGHITKQSSMYLIHREGYSCAVLVAFLSRLSMKRFAMTGDNGEPIGAPSVCL